MFLRQRVGLRTVQTLIKRQRKLDGDVQLKQWEDESGVMSPLCACLPRGDPLFHFTDEQTEAGGEGDLPEITWLEAGSRRQGMGGERHREQVQMKSQDVCSGLALATMDPWSAGQGN